MHGSGRLNPSGQRRGLGVYATTSAERLLWEEVRACNLDGVAQLVRREGSGEGSRGAGRGLFNVNARDDAGSTVLHWSVSQGRVELTATLAKLPNIALDARDARGRTPLHLAALQAHESPEHLQCLFLLVELGGVELAGVADDDGATALHVAAEKGALQTARILIHTGVKVDCANHDGMAPLQVAARNGQKGVVQTLLQAGANLKHVDFDGHAALAHASAAGHLDVVSLLLRVGADASASDLLSDSPLKLAIRHSHLDVSSLLIRTEEAVDLRACGVHEPKWLASLCANAQAAMSMNLSANSIGDEGAVSVLSAAAVSMTKLVVLDLSKNNIKGTAIGALGADVMLGLSCLSSLSLAQNLLVELAWQMSGLRGLVSLDLSSNMVSALPADMAACSALQRLNVSHNKLRVLCDAVCELGKLVVLDVACNMLVRLPSRISALSNLQMLRASDNKLESLPSLPTALLSLLLDRNRITEIPPQVGDAAGLEALHVMHNKLENLPPTLARTALRQSRGLKVEGNPLSCIPRELCDSPNDILGFLEDVHEGLEQVLFIRVMVMGDEGAGKTSLVRCLHDPDMSLKALLRQPRLPDTGGSTLGVEAAKADTTCSALGAKVSMQFWDLAGQACYLVGHSLLMSDRVLPLYVMDASGRESVGIDAALKWLDTLMLALPPVPHSSSSHASASPASPSVAGQRDSPADAKRIRRVSSASSEGPPTRPSLDGSELPEDLALDHVSPLKDSSGDTASAPSGVADQAPSSPAVRLAGGGEGGKGGSSGGGVGGSWVVSVVIIGTKVEAGSCEREAAIEKLQAVTQAMIERTKKLHGRKLCVRAVLGVSHSTRECFDARSLKDYKANGMMNFKQVLQRIAEAALGVLYTDRQYPRALVPVAYTKLRAALSTYGTNPVLDLDFVSNLAQQHAGITDQDKLHRALAMLQCWGVLVYFRDSPTLHKTVLQARWCSTLIYTLFMCAHYATSKQEHQGSSKALNDMEETLGSKVDLQKLAASDPGGSLLLRGIVTRGAVEAMFGGLARAAGLKTTELCVALLEHVRILYRVADDSFVVPSLFQHSLPPRMRSVIRGGSHKTLQWSSCREYRFNILPYKLAAALTVSVCASADLRSGAGSVMTWSEGVWLQSHDGTAVLIDTQQSACTITVNTMEVLPHSILAPNERLFGANSRGQDAEALAFHGVGRKGSPTLRWVSKMQNEMELLLARFPGVSVEIWIRCPQAGCREFLPFQRMLGGGGSGWENMSVVWDCWQGPRCGGGGEGGGDGRVRGGMAMCGHVPDAHSFPVSLWVLGSAPRRRAPPPAQHGGIAGRTVSDDSDTVSTVRNGLPTAAGSISTDMYRCSTSADATADVLVEDARPLSLRPWSQSECSGLERDKGAAHGDELEAVVLGTNLEHGDHTLAPLEARDEWVEEGVEMANYGAIAAGSLAEYMSDPLHPDQLAVQDNLVLEALTACCGDAREVEGMHGFMAEVLHEVEEWAPVCRAVFGVIGACLVATGRGKANETERRRFHERMVSLAKTLMQVRGTFAHNPPPQMEGLLITLKGALVWMETFDGRGWFMRALKSSADRDALKSFNDSITALCSDMSISLQAAAHRDEHMVLRQMTGVLMHEMRRISHEVRHVAHSQTRAQNRILLHPAPEDAPISDAQTSGGIHLTQGREEESCSRPAPLLSRSSVQAATYAGGGGAGAGAGAGAGGADGAGGGQHLALPQHLAPTDHQAHAANATLVTHSCKASESTQIVTSAECLESPMSLSEMALFDLDGLIGPGPPQSCSTGVEGAGASEDAVMLGDGGAGGGHGGEGWARVAVEDAADGREGRDPGEASPKLKPRSLARSAQPRSPLAPPLFAPAPPPIPEPRFGNSSIFGHSCDSCDAADTMANPGSPSEMFVGVLADTLQNPERYAITTHAKPAD